MCVRTDSLTTSAIVQGGELLGGAKRNSVDNGGDESMAARIVPVAGTCVGANPADNTRGPTLALSGEKGWAYAVWSTCRCGVGSAIRPVSGNARGASFFKEPWGRGCDLKRDGLNMVFKAVGASPVDEVDLISDGAVVFGAGTAIRSLPGSRSSAAVNVSGSSRTLPTRPGFDDVSADDTSRPE